MYLQIVLIYTRRPLLSLTSRMWPDHVRLEQSFFFISLPTFQDVWSELNVTLRAHWSTVILTFRLPRLHTNLQYTLDYIDGLMQERRNSIANALELRRSCTKPSIWNAYFSAIFLSRSGRPRLHTRPVATLQLITWYTVAWRLTLLGEHILGYIAPFLITGETAH